MTKKKLFGILKCLPSLLWWGAVLLTAVLVAVFLSAHFRGEVPSVFGYSVMHIVSDSMETTIEKDDYILIKRADPSEVEKNDIICFYSTDPQIYGYPNTHRVIEEPIFENGEYRYITKGDKSPLPDTAHAEGDRLIGIYVRELVVFTAMMHFINENMVVLFFVLFLLCAASAFIPLFFKRNTEKTDK